MYLRHSRLTTVLSILTLLSLSGPLLAKQKAREKAPAAIVDINSASQKELEALPGVGAATAKKIIAGRPFGSVNDLSMAGLSAKTIDEIRPMVTAGATRGVAPVAPAAKTAPVQAASGRPATAVAAPPAAGSVDLNAADQKSLEALPGIGAITARKIIAGRPYKDVTELARAGVSAKQIDGIRSMVSVRGAMPPAPMATAAPAIGTPAVAASRKTGVTAVPMTGAPVDLNTADEKTIEALPGVGPVLARQIVAARPYKSVDDLDRVKGIGPAKMASLRSRVAVTTTAPPPVSAAPPASAPNTAPAGSSRAHAAAEPKLAPGEKVNINTATREKLIALPGIGPVKSQAIIDGRPYSKIEDVMKVKGIKQGEFAHIRDIITVQ